MKEDNFLKILRLGIGHWNQWRANHPSEKVELGGWRGGWLDLRSADLGNADFHDCTFVYSRLDGANLACANLSGATFYKSNSIAEADLSQADLGGARVDFPDQGHGFTLKGSKLCNANLKNCAIFGDLSYADLSRADLTEAYLGGLLIGARFVQAIASRATLEGDLRGGNLSKAILRRANLNGTILSDADLSEVDMRSAKFGNADLENANFTGAILDGVDLRKARLAHTDFRSARLKRVNLSGANLQTASLGNANLSRANLSFADLTGTNLVAACLAGANIERATLTDADLSHADLSGARLVEATLIRTKMSTANLSDSDLQRATLVRTVFEGAKLSGARVYGASVWDLRLNGAEQLQLLITPEDQPSVRVDNLEVAQFIYLLLNNERIRYIIDTISTKGVLILGRFTNDRKAVLDAIRNRLRELGFVPIMFDFEKPSQRDFTETVKVLAGLSHFIIADITNPKSSPLELQATIPDYMVPFVPIIQEDEEPFAMFHDLKQKYGEWVLDVLKYDSAANLLKVFDKAVVRPALEASDKLMLKKAETLRTRHVKDYQ
jgi:uncharacterized protein YjbI with pentapeptide repeats